jgi:hypothetical protein
MLGARFVSQLPLAVEQGLAIQESWTASWSVIAARECLMERCNNDDASWEVLLLWMIGNVFPGDMDHLLEAVPFRWAENRIPPSHTMRGLGSEYPRCKSVHPSDKVAGFEKFEWGLRGGLFVKSRANLKKSFGRFYLEIGGGLALTTVAEEQEEK